jgi:hypothetical protein
MGERNHGNQDKSSVFHEEGIQSAKDIGETSNISGRTMRRWAQSHRQDPENGLRPKRPGRNDHPDPYHYRRNNKSSNSKRNLLHGKADVVNITQSSMLLENGSSYPHET